MTYLPCDGFQVLLIAWSNWIAGTTVETNIPLTTKKVPISRTCPRLFGSFVGSPWTLNRYRSTGCYLFHLFLLHERLAGLALNCFEIPGFLSLQLVLHFLHLLQFSLNLEWQGYSMVTIASRNLILVASSLEAEIKMNQCPKCQTTWICLESGIKTWKQHRPKTGFTACAIRLAKASLTSILDIRLTASCRVPSMPCWEIPGGTNCNPPSLWSLMSLNWGEVCKSFFIHVCPPSSIVTTTRCGRCVWFPRSNPVTQLVPKLL